MMRNIFRKNIRPCPPTPEGCEFVKCKILKPNGSVFREEIPVTVGFPEEAWSGFIKPGLRGNIKLPAYRRQDQTEQDYFCYISSKDGYLAIKDPGLIKHGVKLKLIEGGLINPYWRGEGLHPDIISSESYIIPDISEGLVTPLGKSPENQRPPGPCVIQALFSWCDYTEYSVAYRKLCIVEQGKTIDVELGSNIKDYKINCLLPEKMSKNLKITLSLNNTDEFKYPCFIKKEDMDEITRMAKSGLDHFYFKDWPIKDNCFDFIADENNAVVNIMLKHGNHEEILQTVEFQKGEARSKTVDLRNNENLTDG